MNKWLDEMRSLDIRNPGGWPWSIKFAALALIVAAILVGAYFIFYQTQLEDLKQAHGAGTDDHGVGFDDGQQQGGG